MLSKYNYKSSDIIIIIGNAIEHTDTQSRSPDSRLVRQGQRTWKKNWLASFFLLGRGNLSGKPILYCTCTGVGGAKKCKIKHSRLSGEDLPTSVGVPITDGCTLQTTVANKTFGGSFLLLCPILECPWKRRSFHCILQRWWLFNFLGGLGLRFSFTEITMPLLWRLRAHVLSLLSSEASRVW